MGYWIFMLVCSLMIPAVMVIFGWVFKKHPPQRINWLYGYRTNRSMKSEEAWNFAHDYCGELWWKIGWIMFPLSLVAMLFVMGSEADKIDRVAGTLVFIQLFPLCLSVIPVEKALKKNFDEDGVRR